MTDSCGIDVTTGKLLTDWDHTQQSIQKIVTTALKSRVMRRGFGSDLPDLVDLKMIRKNILSVYSATATAIAKWEPRYRMRTGQVISADATGRLSLNIVGIYFPRGHLGDYSIAEDKATRVVLTT